MLTIIYPRRPGNFRALHRLWAEQAPLSAPPLARYAAPRPRRVHVGCLLGTCDYVHLWAELPAPGAWALGYSFHLSYADSNVLFVVIDDESRTRPPPLQHQGQRLWRLLRVTLVPALRACAGVPGDRVGRAQFPFSALLIGRSLFCRRCAEIMSVLAECASMFAEMPTDPMRHMFFSLL